MSLRDVRAIRGVPAWRGMRVTVDGRPGVITSAHGLNIRVRFDGHLHSVPCHPKWRVIYHTPEGDIAFGMPLIPPPGPDACSFCGRPSVAVNPRTQERHCRRLGCPHEPPGNRARACREALEATAHEEVRP